MKKNLLKKEIRDLLGLFVLIFAAVFSAVSILSFSKTIGDNQHFIFVNPNANSNANIDAHLDVYDRCVQTSQPASIFISKINITAPLVFPDASESPDFKEALEKGVIVHPLSSLPDKVGMVMILGHSAPLGWPKIKYDWVFSDLNNLATGDSVNIFYQGCQYSYQISDKYFLERGESLPNNLGEDSNSVLILISCWPPGKDYRRIAVVAKIE